MSKKLKILLVNEASYALTGFGTYGKEILTRLYNSKKYHIAEFASYACIGDKRDANIPWRFYPNAVAKTDPRYKEYNSKMSNRFGEWRFETVLLDFKPQIVVGIRDPWMMSFEGTSPLRPYFHHCIMPTVDSAPQKLRWIQMFMEADAVFVYSEWALDVLDKQSNGKIKLQTAAYPGIDPQVYKPVLDKKAHKKSMNIPEDSYVFGFVSRNQVRKLYPDLFHAFRLFLDMAPKEIADKTYLYVHTSYPDKGWEIPELLQEFNIGNKVFFTYICRVTNEPYCTQFQGARTYSPFSNSATGTLPNTAIGLTQEQMVKVYNCFDAYIQYATCEGSGMPTIEASSCSVPVMAVNYSAMADIVKNTGGIPLKVERMFRDIDTGAYRALPDNKYCAEKMLEFLTKTTRDKHKMSAKVRASTIVRYNWDRTAKIWMDYFDSLQLTGKQGKWQSPLVLCQIPSTIPDGLSNPQFVKWLFHNVIFEPEQDNGRHALEILKDLNHGATLKMGELVPIQRKEIFELFCTYAKNKNLCERGRFDKPSMADFIQYAHMKENLNV